ncbi:MAG: grasp-with-spasm system ATP-grasp peptide maturase [Chryseobacterium sp.]|nr:MAG: grasp-with-spasm system ATP-grasp peptide maturase [Chryseobacterium sp.]
MVLVLSIKNDYSTMQVCEWLHRLGKDFIRINGDEASVTKFIKFDIHNDELLLDYKGTEFNLLSVDSVWYRRSGLGKNLLNIDRKSFLSNHVIADDINYHVKYHDKEFKILIDTIYYFLEKKKSLNKNGNASLNKLITLDLAKKNGLKIPESRIFSRKIDLTELLKNKKSVITKALSEGVYHFTPKNAYYSYTEKLTSTSMDSLPDTFYPSLIQDEIIKKYELRVFYLNGTCYPMVIFSQNDSQTEVDFRKYNLVKPNRMVPFRLNDDVSKNIQGLMKDLDLNSGSIDIVVSSDNDYYFLEVNPVGQFAMTSEPCNYQLEKKMAEYL